MSKTLLYSLAFITLGLSVGSLGPTLLALATHTQAELHQISYLFITRSLGTMLGSWLIGRWYDRSAGHPLLALSLLLLAGLMALVPTINLLWPLCLLFTLLGLASASINVGGNTLIVLVHGERARPFISALHFAFGLGGLLAPLLVAHFVHWQRSLHVTYWLLALLGVLPALCTIFSPSPELRAPQESQSAPALAPLVLFLFVLFFFLEIGAEASLMGWLSPYAARHGMNERSASLISSAFWAAFTFARLATIWLTTRFNALPMVIVHLCATALIALAMLALPTTPAVLWLGATGLGLAIAPIFPNTFGYAQRRLGLTGRVLGLFLIGSSAGGMFWPWLVGQLIEPYGPQVMMWIVLIGLLGALAMLAVLIVYPVRAAARSTMLQL